MLTLDFLIVAAVEAELPIHLTLGPFVFFSDQLKFRIIVIEPFAPNGFVCECNRCHFPSKVWSYCPFSGLQYILLTKPVIHLLPCTTMRHQGPRNTFAVLDGPFISEYKALSKPHARENNHLRDCGYQLRNMMSVTISDVRGGCGEYRAAPSYCTPQIWDKSSIGFFSHKPLSLFGNVTFKVVSQKNSGPIYFKL
ncbi:uncharacterized protein PITG_11227 [Phytophthora infestans T30-4]|uniref:Uncharacterized protein n=1 Tax=Phytophthora infestans (strain T30-4) TaxID=403677 RepID=D0NGH5_PHYIT|nr:uncharacterized protein PITG_11227 [Phytophthora infestans T30-4]EEY57376.1 hypothetical protein PITG_11227 [Phytophthora infestans T30-4]|eukprot:XP_002901986.1 hypothetical protein PITG_11227 [Phytophthora infestans T30-4]